jgi:hypothetical protein
MVHRYQLAVQGEAAEPKHPESRERLRDVAEEVLHGRREELILVVAADAHQVKQVAHGITRLLGRLELNAAGRLEVP